MLTTHFHLVKRLRMSGAIRLLSPYMSSWRGQGQIYLFSFQLPGTILPQKLTSSQLVKKFPAFHDTRRFTAAFTRARYLSQPWTTSIQPTNPHSTSRISILILSSHLSLSLRSDLFTSGFLTKTLYVPFFLSSFEKNCKCNVLKFWDSHVNNMTWRHAAARC